jgi:hypothetical protein
LIDQPHTNNLQQQNNNKRKQKNQSNMKLVFGAAVFAALVSVPTITLADDRPFTYLDFTDEKGFGVQDWNQVQPAQYQLDWNAFHKKANFDKNFCQWKPSDGDGDDNDGGGHTQTPIDIDDWDGTSIVIYAFFILPEMVHGIMHVLLYSTCFSCLFFLF